MKNHSKGNNNKNEIELLLRKALRIKQKPSQELNDSIIRQYEKIIEQRKIGCVNKFVFLEIYGSFFTDLPVCKTHSLFRDVQISF